MCANTPEAAATDRSAVVRFTPSRRLRLAFAVTLVLLTLLPLPALWPHGLSAWPWMLPVAAFWGLIGVSWRRFVHHQRTQPRGIEHTGGGWFLWWGNHREPAEPVGQWLLWPQLQWLCFDVGGNRCQFACLSDSASPEQRRRLRQWMRLHGP